MKNKKIIIIWCLNLLLLITFLCSYLNSSNKDNRKVVKTALLNPKNISQITQIQFSQNNTSITLKYDEFWKLYEGTDISSTSNYLPGDTAKIQAFIDKLSQINDFYLISENFNTKDNFNINSDSTFRVIYYLNDGSSTQLNFGNHDFTSKFRYLNNSINSKVYEINSNIDDFLSVSVYSWSSVKILSPEILLANKIDSVDRIIFKSSSGNRILNNSNKEELDRFTNILFSLQHNGLCDSSLIDSSKDEKIDIQIDFDDKSILNLEINNSILENEYLVHINYSSKMFKNPVSYVIKISNWTYSKINTSKL